MTGTVEAFGGVDILVNNVGTAKGSDIVSTEDAEWQEAFDHTLYPAIRMSRLVVPHMRARGGGSIVMIASIWGRESGGRMVYNAVKAAEISLAKAMARQLAKDAIRVNSVAPGSMRASTSAAIARSSGLAGRLGSAKSASSDSRMASTSETCTRFPPYSARPSTRGMAALTSRMRTRSGSFPAATKSV